LAVTRRARDVLLDILRDEGVTHVFGNPGSTEMPLMDALVDAPDIRYVLGLQEATAVGMADGRALASGRAAFVNLHAMGGLGNAMGVLVASKASETPLVVTAGQQDTRHLMTEPWLSGDLVVLAQPVTKWAKELRRGEDVGQALRRASAIARTQPSGPVFLSLPMDILDQEVMGPTPPASSPPRSALRPTRRASPRRSPASIRIGSSCCSATTCLPRQARGWSHSRKPAASRCGERNSPPAPPSPPRILHGQAY
jgi:benzoylformate decarboxylase